MRIKVGGSREDGFLIGVNRAYVTGGRKGEELCLDMVTGEVKVDTEHLFATLFYLSGERLYLEVER